MERHLRLILCFIIIVPTIILSLLTTMVIIMWGRQERTFEKVVWLEDLALGRYEIVKKGVSDG